METGGVPVRKERQSRAVPAHHAGAQRKRLIFSCCNLAFRPPPPTVTRYQSNCRRLPKCRPKIYGDTLYPLYL